MRHQIDPSQIARAGGFQKAGKGKGKRGIDKGFGRLFKGQLEKTSRTSKTAPVKGNVKQDTIQSLSKETIDFSKAVCNISKEVHGRSAKIPLLIGYASHRGFTIDTFTIATNIVAKAEEGLKALELANKSYVKLDALAHGKITTIKDGASYKEATKELKTAASKEAGLKSLIKSLKKNYITGKSKLDDDNKGIDSLDLKSNIENYQKALAKKMGQQMLGSQG